MKKCINILAVLLLAVAILPIFKANIAKAETSGILCQYDEGQDYSPGTANCDLSIVKKVRVNNGVFVDAPDSASAVQAHLGDTLTWQVTVDNNSPLYYTPLGTVIVSDLLPNNVNLVSTSSTNYSNGKWTIDASNGLPQTLTIVTTASTLGLVENTATLTNYVPNCDGSGCVAITYCDASKANNTSSAFANVTIAPIILPLVTTPNVIVPVRAITPAAPNTGFGKSDNSVFNSSIEYILLATMFTVLAIRARNRSDA